MKRKDYITSSQYLRDFYIKDFKYISPEVLRNKKNDNKSSGRTEACTLFVKLWLREVLKGFKQFLYEGSLHGVKYIFEPSFSYNERVTWIIIVVISISICAMNIIQLVCKWTSTPFVNVIDSLPTPIWAVPFPSVVLCPHLHIKLSFANVSKLNDMESFFASLVCPQMDERKFEREERLSVVENKMLQDFILKGSPTCSDLVKVCHWRSGYDTAWFRNDCCEKLLKPIFTEYGLCYTFNSLPLNGMTNETIAWQKTFNRISSSDPLEWDLDSGYPKVFPPKPGTLPLRVMASGEVNGLSIELYLNTSEHQYDCDGNNVGFNVLISSPTDHVYTSTILRLPMDRMTTIEVSPITYKTDTSLRALSPDQRQCFFQNERKLQYYEFYTDTNCKLDLRIRETMKHCRCVLYNWPIKVGEQLIYAYYADSEEQRQPHEGATSCYPACNDILYSTQVYYSDLIRDHNSGKANVGKSNKGEKTHINIHFYDDMFLGQHRHAQYDDYYFAGAIGGLLSLFLGFSIISVAELVYFVMLKPIHIAFKDTYYKKR
ncbi:pickpocket protein 28-like [Vanessa cardui]|uniref:pickpocket protein 28-like n=1 Tax=Vanessa cardui TaxID=171605 RepID=UPI001F12CBB0|nr:pickpocket protein 28-like [Vanessa cardui]